MSAALPSQPAIAETVAALRAIVRGYRAAGETVALVPTMGALHEGHLQLVREGRKRADRAIATIFVNPTQFGPNEDFARYPRDRDGDLAKLASAGASAVFLPTVETMYPSGFATTVSVAGLTEGLCGAYRPGHFAGVATVVTKLLMQALPDVALFGEKDYQQLQVIKRFVRDLDIPVEIHGVPTIREADGLALSSRNAYLTPAERAVAPLLHALLDEIAAKLQAGQDAAPLLEAGMGRLGEAGFGPVQYLAFVDADTLEPMGRADRPGRLLVAAYLGKTRLIDNIAVPPRGA
ncbi:pantoate--beta-alanine ligase [Chelatococcus asaccharovorans]|uniref:Pantothenate synthetase n=1 Tax=Chelatococcus asaccharovorans TaxID=28210 RepID=A0A2V3TYV9_9HYPH|nr:pantoate--beta-alanine ligase [Chelatococcus asaccharovorans]MBS7704851.1 pantoate--beta-alanine ligase [Chelatococcus asaccharovorans]PXW54748.1 pantoate--beta-alanine ligase [Chelatococcus asaccharovorans]